MNEQGLEFLLEQPNEQTFTPISNEPQQQPIAQPDIIAPQLQPTPEEQDEYAAYNTGYIGQLKRKGLENAGDAGKLALYYMDSGDAPKTTSQKLADLRNLYDTGYIQDPDVIAAEAEKVRKISGREYGQYDYHQYMPPTPELSIDEDEETKLKKVKQWRDSVEAYGRTRSKEEGVYSDWLTKKEWINAKANEWEEALSRQATGADTGYVADKLYRFGEALTEAPIKALGMAGTAQSIRSFFNENPEYDADTAAAFATALGQGIAQIGVGTAVGLGMTAATGGNVAAGAWAGTVASTAMSGSIQFQDTYNEIYSRTGDADAALKGALTDLPAVALEGITDRLVLGKLMPKLAKGLTQAQKVEKTIETVKKISTEFWKGAAEAGLSEALTENIQNIYNRNIVKSFSGEAGQDINPYDLGDIAQTTIVSAATGGLLGGGAGAISAMGQRAGATNDDIAGNIKEKMVADGVDEGRVSVNVTPSGKAVVNMGDNISPQSGQQQDSAYQRIIDISKQVGAADRIINPDKYALKTMEEAIDVTPEATDVTEEAPKELTERQQKIMNRLAAVDTKIVSNEAFLDLLEEEKDMYSSEEFAIRKQSVQNIIENLTALKENEVIELTKNKVIDRYTPPPVDKPAMIEMQRQAKALEEEIKMLEATPVEAVVTEPSVEKPKISVEEIVAKVEANPEISQNTTALNAIKTSLQSDKPVATINQKIEETTQEYNKLQKACEGI